MNRVTASLDALRPYVPVAIRVTLGYLLLRHGLDKFDAGLENVGNDFSAWGVPLPDVSATFVAVLEVVGGVALIAGFATRLVAAAMSLVLVGAIWFVKADIGILGGAETDLAYIAALLSLVATGPGRWSVDQLIGLERSPATAEAPAAERTAVNA